MKILFITLTNTQGIVRYNINIANELLELGNDVYIISSKYFNHFNLDDRVNLEKLVDTKKPRIEKSTFDVKCLMNIIKLIKKIRPDVIHFTSPHPLNIPLSFLLSKFKRVITVHDPEPHPNEKISQLHYLYNKLVMRYLTDKIIVHGKSHINILKKMKVDYKGKYIKMGIEPASETVTDLPNRKTVLFFGRIKPYKGLDLFIESALLLIERGYEYNFVIAGDGQIGKYSKILENNDNFEIYNYLIPEEDIQKYFINSSIVVLPYTSASQSGIIPIAYYYSRPVVVTNVGALPEYVENYNTGIIVESVDANSIAEAIVNLLEDGDRLLKMSKNSFEKLRNDLSINAMCRTLVDVYLS